MKRKGEKRVGQSRPKIKKTTYFVLAMICLTIICISPIFIGKWLIQRQAEAKINYKTSTGTKCTCGIDTTTIGLTYNGEAQNPQNLTAFTDVLGTTDFETAEKAGIVFKNVTLAFNNATGFTDASGNAITATNTDFKAGDTPIEWSEVVWKWAGKYTFEIIDNATGQVLCPHHEMTINPFTITYGTLTIPGTKFKDESITGQVNWTALDTTYSATNIPFTAGDFVKKLTDDDTDMAYSQSVEYSVPYDTIRGKIGVTLAEIENNFNQSKVTGSFKVLPTSYAVSGSDKIFFGSLENALSYDYGTATTTIVAMQSFSYGTSTYSVKIGDGEIIQRNDAKYKLLSNPRGAIASFSNATSDVVKIGVYGSAGKDGNIIIDFEEEVKKVQRPETLYNKKDAYALNLCTRRLGSLLPTRSILYVDPQEVVSVGDIAVHMISEVEAQIISIRENDNGQLYGIRWNPEEKIELGNDDLQNVHKVVFISL